LGELLISLPAASPLILNQIYLKLKYELCAKNGTTRLIPQI
jgi:hypothetical protein